jgi:hypothetical protein
MSDDSKQSLPSIGGNGFVWILLVAAGTYFVAQKLPLEGSRPPTTETVIGERGGAQNVDARLWQDPFSAVAEALARSPDLKPGNCRSDATKDPIQQAAIRELIRGHCETPLKGSDPSSLLVMVAPVSGAPYSEEHETRRRTRYAILAGLSADGFIPEDPQHLGFYWPSATAPLETTADSQPAKDAPQISLPKVVPFEWFTRAPRGKSEYQRVLLVWFDEDALREAPINQFDAFLCRSLSLVSPASSSPWKKATVLGPSLSTTLQSMVDERSKQGFSRVCPDAARPDFYVNSATADDPTLIPTYVLSGPPCVQSDTCLHDFFADQDPKRDVKLYRMIASDQAVARTISTELRLRRVDDKTSHIALVSEWDTLYGRALPDSIARCFPEEQGNDTQPEGCRGTGRDAFLNKSRLHRFKYLRGLDGQVPGAESPGAGSGSKDSGNKQDKGGKESAKISDAKPQERAEGQGQFDYLRRLGDHIQQLDSELRQRNLNGIEAVGILGSDLYDKLLVLQALRPLLPNALFFTTDLDAIVLHPSALTYTRNLLVASSFGLQLRPAFQAGIPAFRSSYQTAAFLATRAAIHGKQGAPAAWLTPRIFEVGTARVFQFASRGSHDEQSESEDQRSDRKKCDEDALTCDEIHPLAMATFRKVSPPFAAAFSIVAICIALYVAGSRARGRLWGWVDGFMNGAKGRVGSVLRGAAMLVALGLLVYGLAEGIHAFWPWLARKLTYQGQPMILLDGISVWPTILLRLIGLGLCIWFVIHGYWLLDDNIKKIFRDLDLTEMRERVQAEQDRIMDKAPPWTRFVSHFWYHLPEGRAAPESERLPDRIFRFWRMYIYQGQLRARCWRVSAGVVGMFLLGWVLFLAFDNPPVPARGPVSFESYQWVTMVFVVVTWFLIFSVADTTLLTWNVVRGFRMESGIWPAKTLQQFSHRLGLAPDVLEDWVSLLFASKRTKCITTFIYYPFLILALLVVSRSRLFANFGPSIPIVITTGIAVLIVIGCAVALRLAAEALRAKARRRLNDRIMAARKSANGGQLSGQLELLLRRVEELREGAFTPFSQQPMVRATLLPLGSFGGTALLEYLIIPSFS